jgi:hypothetical protein
MKHQLNGPRTSVQTTNAPPTGAFSFTDDSPPPFSAYYRISYQP